MSQTITARRAVLLSFFKLVAVQCVFLFAAQAIDAQQPRENSQTKYVIERLELIGNRRVETETLHALISSRPGDSYSVESVRRDVRGLWNTQFFDEVRSEVEESPHLPNGKIVVFIFRERPIIDRIEYKGIKSITESDILDAFKDERVGLSVGSWFDQAKLKHAVLVISGLLAAHGHQVATVKPTYEIIPSTNTVTLVFNIDEGPKALKSRNRSSDALISDVGPGTQVSEYATQIRCLIWDNERQQILLQRRPRSGSDRTDGRCINHCDYSLESVRCRRIVLHC